MKFLTSTLCLILASFGILGAEADFDPITARWMRERAIFKTGRQMMNDRGELVNVTVSKEPIKAGRPSTGEVKFWLFNNNHPNGSVEVNLDIDSLVSSSYYDVGVPTVFITHGWISSSSSNSCTLIRDAYLKRGGFNVIVVDWSSISFSLYEIAVWQVHDVGLKVANVIKRLSTNGYLKIEETLLVGHSLGAHVMGTAGYTLEGAVKAIFGLDPALPLFRSAAVGWRLTKSDAQYVEIIHTNTGYLGMNGHLAHADFFINNGLDQPNCNGAIDNACSHNRAYELYAESLNSPVPFLGQKCESIYAVVVGTCDNKHVAVMGGSEVDPKVNGIFEVITNTSPPYAMGNVFRARYEPFH